MIPRQKATMLVASAQDKALKKNTDELIALKAAMELKRIALQQEYEDKASAFEEDYNRKVRPLETKRARLIAMKIRAGYIEEADGLEGESLGHNNDPRLEVSC